MSYSLVDFDENDDGFTPINISKKQKNENNYGFKEVKDVAKQFPAEYSKGLLGSYGDILDLFNLQPNETLPGEKANYQNESDILDRMNQPGYQPSFFDFLGLSDESDIVPRYSKLPSSEDVGNLTEMLGINPGEAETAPGRLAGRFGRLLGGGTAFGIPASKGAALASASGQALEGLGAPEWLQSLGEVGGFVASHKLPNGTITSKNPVIKKTLQELKEVGLSNKDLKIAKSSLEPRPFLSKTAKMTPKAQQDFSNALKSSENAVNDMFGHAFPGFQEGIPEIEKASSDLFNTVARNSERLIVGKPDKFINTGKEVIGDIKQSLANTPEEKQIISILNEAVDNATRNPSADNFISFYQGLNQMGKWVNPSKRERVFGKIKKSIVDTFRENGPFGNELADQFENANKSYVRLKLAEDVTKKIQPALTEEGMDFKKLSKILGDKKNESLFEKSLGKQQSKLMSRIANTGESIQDLEKSLKDLAKKSEINYGNLGLLYGLAKMSPSIIAKSTIGKISPKIVSRLGTRLLTDPEYQTFSLRVLQAIKNNSAAELAKISDQFKERFSLDDFNEI